MKYVTLTARFRLAVPDDTDPYNVYIDGGTKVSIVDTDDKVIKDARVLAYATVAVSPLEELPFEESP